MELKPGLVPIRKLGYLEPAMPKPTGGTSKFLLGASSRVSPTGKLAVLKVSINGA